MLADAILNLGKKKLGTPLTHPFQISAVLENGDGPPSRARQGRARSADGLSTRASLIACSRNCQPASPPGLQPHPLVRGPPSPLLLAPQTAAMCVLVPPKSAGVYGRAQKLCCLIAMLSMQPRIESGRLSLRKRASGKVKAFSRFLASSVVLGGCSGQQSRHKGAQ